MKQIIKRILPEKAKKIILKFIDKRNLKKAYKLDLKRFTKCGFDLVKKSNKENLEAKIILYYHSLEKGLSNINFRYGFGERAYKQLIASMQEYFNKNYDLRSTAYRTGLSVLREYVRKHEKTNIDTNYIQKNLDILSNYDSISDLGGIYIINKDEVVANSKSDFKLLTSNRYSVRDYDKNPIDIELINDALNLAKRTPSVCNRQPWHSHIIKDKNLINQVLIVQGGFKGYGHNIDTLILICSNNNYLANYTERNQGFTDSGMYAMSLIYALQYFGLATCALNANLSFEGDHKVRSLLSIPDNQNLVMFISVGNYEDTFKVTKSAREDIKAKTTYHN